MHLKETLIIHSMSQFGSKYNHVCFLIYHDVQKHVDVEMGLYNSVKKKSMSIIKFIYTCTIIKKIIKTSSWRMVKEILIGQIQATKQHFYFID